MGVSEHRKKSEERIVKCAVLTISDTRTKNDDASGKFTTAALKKRGYRVLYYNIVKDDIDLIKNKIKETLKKDIDVIITNGGTGVCKRDVTIEAVEPLITKKLDGFGELFRYLSYKKIGTASIITRAVAGITKEGKVIICLPGSLNAVKLAVNNIILPEIRHIACHAAL
jgi:molybdenum cofactor biosynthesis protein B